MKSGSLLAIDGFDPGVKPFVISQGSAYTRCGSFGEVIPTFVGLPSDPWPDWLKGKNHAAGEKAIELRFRLSPKYPISHEFVDSGQRHHVSYIWSAAYNQLNVNSSEHPVVLNEPVGNSPRTRQFFCSRFFQDYRVPAFFLGTTQVFSLVATGRSTGLVLDSGSDGTRVVPVSECLPVAVDADLRQRDSGGKFLSECLGVMVYKKTNREVVIAPHDHPYNPVPLDIKQKQCFVAQDFEEEFLMFEATGSVPHLEMSYELPDGSSLQLGHERCFIPEILFRPQIAVDHCSEVDGSSQMGKYLPIHELVLKGINGVSEDLRGQMCANIVLSGGNTQFSGFAERLESEMKSLDERISIDAREERDTLAWKGASIMCAMPEFADHWVMKAEFEESGESIILRKCF